MSEPSLVVFTNLLSALMATPVAAPVHQPRMSPIGSFRATCHKSYQQPDTRRTDGTWNAGAVIQCDEVFEGTQDIARYTEHMTKLHGLSIRENTGISTPAWLTSKPYSFKAPRRTGSLPPAGKRRDDYLAAMESVEEESAA